MGTTGIVHEQALASDLLGSKTSPITHTQEPLEQVNFSVVLASHLFKRKINIGIVPASGCWLGGR